MLAASLACAHKDLGFEAVLQGVIAEEHEAQLVRDAQHIQQQPHFVVALPEPLLVVVEELEDVAGEVAEEPAVVQAVQDLRRLLAAHTEVVEGLDELLLGDKLHGEELLLEDAFVLLGDLLHQRLQRVQPTVLLLVQLAEAREMVRLMGSEEDALVEDVLHEVQELEGVLHAEELLRETLYVEEQVLEVGSEVGL